jgi:sugar phosphate isomerase/epimerase
MKIALSGRLWETPNGPSQNLEQQIEAAAALDYEGFEIRYPLLPQKSEWEKTRELLQRYNMQHVFSAAGGTPSTPDKRADFIRVLDTAAFLGAPYIKQIPRDDESEIEAMRIAADLGAERGIKIVSQYHNNSLTDTVARTERFFEKLDHPNVGIIFDACHIPFTESPVLTIEEVAARLRPWIELANLQSYKPSVENDGLRHTKIGGREWSLALPDEPDSTDLRAVLRVLQSQNYDGWLMVMPAVDPSQQPFTVAKSYRDFLQSALP